MNLEWYENNKGNLIATKSMDGNALFFAFITMHQQRGIRLTIDVKQEGVTKYSKELKEKNIAEAKASAVSLYTSLLYALTSSKDKENSNGVYLETPEIVRAVQKELAKTKKNG